jgi:hypothetical protein
MQARWPSGRLASACAVIATLAGTITGVTAPSASASACQALVTGQPPSPGTSVNQLNSVTVLSPCNAWAVGSYASGGIDQTLIEHWNGAAWKVVPSPNPGDGGNFLDGVRAASATDIWAVGGYFNNLGDITLILHWDGHTWKQAAGVPSPGASPRLVAVRAVSASNAWAIGESVSNSGSRSFILHWNGHHWTPVPSPSLGASDTLNGLAATSAGNAWAVGVFIKNNRDRTFILRWNGSRWLQVASPNPPGNFGVELRAVTATSASDAWAVGNFANSAGRERTLILHWNGRQWTQVASPNPGGAKAGESLTGVVATAANNAWAVGSYNNSDDTAENVVIAHWDGKKWQAQPGPRLGTFNEFFDVAASSGGNLWAVGDYMAGGPDQNFALHCC